MISYQVRKGKNWTKPKNLKVLQKEISIIRKVTSVVRQDWIDDSREIMKKGA